jgi:phospholipid/cholesterol/gamma-HCH transport system substrate-binding protein
MCAPARVRHRVGQGLTLLVAGVVLTSCASWRGIAGVPIPGGPGSGPGSYTLYVQVPDTLAITGNSRVRVADVFVGAIQDIQLKNWVATLTVKVNKDVALPTNATAKIGQTSLLGSQHIELAAPPHPSPQRLKDGDTIPLQNSSAYPTIEQTLAAIATVLRGGGIPDLEVIQTEVNNIVSGRAPQIRSFLAKLDTFTDQLNQQTGDITRAIDSTNRLLAYAANRSDTIDRVLTDFPPLIQHFAEKQDLLVSAVDAVGRLSQAADQYVSPVRGDLSTNLHALQCPLKELARAAPRLYDALKLLLTLPVNIDGAPKAFRGDFLNVSVMIDLTYASIDNGILTGTGFSGLLRALEQSFGHDPENMIPDVRYTPNPNDAPGGPLVERGDRQC